MTPTRLLIGQIGIVFAIVVLGVWAATQWAAAMLGYQSALGAPWFAVGSLPVYRPWYLFAWWYHYEAYAPQVEIVARAAPKRHYYLQSARGNRLFELGLGPIALAMCGASDPASQARIDMALAAPGDAGFAADFLAASGLGWAAGLLAEFPVSAPPQAGE